MAELTDAGATQSLGRVVAKFLSGSWRATPPDTNISAEDLARITPLLLRSGAASLGWWRIRNGRLSECASGLDLKSAFQLHSLHAAIHKTEIEEIVTLLNSAGVEPVLVKGWAVARLYPEEGLRPYGDIDLCFLPDQYDEAASVLGRVGGREHSIDVHDGFGKLDDMRLEDLMVRSEPAQLGSAKFHLLGLEDQLRILCTHLLRHSAWRPIWLCDIGAAVESAPADFDWERCLGGDRVQADWVACAIGLAHQLLEARVEDTPVAGRAKNLPGWLVPAVIRNWDKPFPENYPPLSYLPPIATYLRHPTGVVKALRTRWPNPIEATIRLRGQFSEASRLPFQIGYTLWRVKKFLTGTQ